MKSSRGRPCSSDLATLPLPVVCPYSPNTCLRGENSRKNINHFFKFPDLSPELVLARRPRPVDLVAEDEDGAVAQLLVCQQGLQLDLALTESGKVHNKVGASLRRCIVFRDSNGM